MLNLKQSAIFWYRNLNIHAKLILGLISFYGVGALILFGKSSAINVLYHAFRQSSFVNILLITIFLLGLLYILFWKMRVVSYLSAEPLVVIFIGAVAVRVIMPFFLLISVDTDPFSFMLASKHRYLWKIALGVASGHYEFSTAITTYNVLTAIPVWVSMLFSSNVAVMLFSAQVFQGVIDSVGCLLVFNILRLSHGRKISLAGAAIYALWVPSIFYAYHILDEAYTPVFVLSIGYWISKYIKTQNMGSLILAGLFSGIALSLRVDNFLILPFVAGYIIWLSREKIFSGLVKAGGLLLICAVSFVLINTGIKNSFTIKSTLYGTCDEVFSACFFNALGEYPATYKGMRFFDNATASIYAREQLAKYSENSSSGPSFIAKTVHHFAPEFSVYIQEVILNRPFLYADWIVRRLIAYLPAHPNFAVVTYFLSSPKKNDKWTMVNYRFSQVFHSFKYFDYLMFGLAVYGVWLCRRNESMMALALIYIGILVGHVFTQCGEAYFRNEIEEVYLNPKYLLGMATIFPLFLPLALQRLFGVEAVPAARA